MVLFKIPCIFYVESFLLLVVFLLVQYKYKKYIYILSLALAGLFVSILSSDGHLFYLSFSPTFVLTNAHQCYCWSLYHSDCLESIIVDAVFDN